MSLPKVTPGSWEPGWGTGLTGPRCGPTARLDGNTVLWPVRSGSDPVCWLLLSQGFGSKEDLYPDAHMLAASKDLYAALADAQEELRLLRMKDTQTIYDPTLRLRISLALAKARGEA